MAHAVHHASTTRIVGTTYVWVVSLIVALGGFLFGFDTALVSGTVELVKQQFALNTLMEGWFVSSALVGCMAGVIVAGSISDQFGRKQTLLLSAVLFIISSVGCILPSRIELLVVARLVGGIGIGIASMLAPLYISEFAPQQLRGRLVSVYQLAITIGIVAAYFSNAFLLSLRHTLKVNGFWEWVLVEEVWRGMLGMNLLPAVLFFLLLFLIPQPPRWLLKQHRSAEALAILRRVMGEAAAQQEIRAITETLQSTPTTLKTLWQPGYRQALWVGLLLPFLGQFSGINAIIYYGPKVFSQAGLTVSDALGGQVTIGLVNVVATFLAISFIDKVGRKPLLLWGTVGLIFALILAAGLFGIGATKGWLFIGVILIFVFCYSFSLGPVQWVVMSEIYPTHIRGKAMGIATLSLWLAATLVAQLFPWMLGVFKPAGAFLCFAVCSVFTLVLTVNYIPETKNKSLEQIERGWLEKARRSKENQLVGNK